MPCLLHKEFTANLVASVLESNLSFSQARKAFTKLAYTKFHHTPLYLEWAPDDTFTRPYVKEEVAEEGDRAAASAAAPAAAAEEEGPPEDGGTLFVKNLNFDTTDGVLRGHFETLGPVHSATVATKKDGKSGDLLSMGYGFVQFYRRKDADRAIKTMQHTRLDGHCLEVTVALSFRCKFSVLISINCFLIKPITFVESLISCITSCLTKEAMNRF